MTTVTILSKPTRVVIATKGVQGAPGPKGADGAPGIATGAEFGVAIARDAGIVAGGYPATRSAWGAMTFNRFYAEAIGGSAVVTVRVNAVTVHGPVTVPAGGAFTQPALVVLAKGDRVTFDVVPDGATRLWAQIDGATP